MLLRAGCASTTPVPAASSAEREPHLVERLVVEPRPSVPPDFESLAGEVLLHTYVGVVREGGLPVEGAHVALLARHGACAGCERCTRTDARGRFALSNAWYENGELRVMASGHSSCGGLESVPTSTLDRDLEVRTEAGGFARVRGLPGHRGVTWVDIELGSSRLEICVRDELGRPVPGARVDLRHLGVDESWPGRLRIDADGCVLVSCLPAATYQVGVAPHLSGGRLHHRVEHDVEVLERGEASVEFVLGAGALTGRLLDARGRPVGAAQLFVTALDESPTPADVIVDTALDGSFRLPHVSAGRQRVVIHAPQHPLEGPDGVCRFEVTVRPGERRSLDLHLPPE